MYKRTMNLKTIEYLTQSSFSKLERAVLEKVFEEGFSEQYIAAYYIIWNFCVRLAGVIDGVDELDRVKAFAYLKKKDSQYGDYVNPVDIPQKTKDIFLSLQNPKVYFMPYNFEKNFLGFCRVMERKNIRSTSEYVVQGYLRFAETKEKEVSFEEKY